MIWYRPCYIPQTFIRVAHRCVFPYVYLHSADNNGDDDDSDDDDGDDDDGDDDDDDGDDDDDDDGGDGDGYDDSDDVQARQGKASAKPYPQEGLEGELAANYGDAPSVFGSGGQRERCKKKREKN